MGTEGGNSLLRWLIRAGQATPLQNQAHRVSDEADAVAELGSGTVDTGADRVAGAEMEAAAAVAVEGAGAEAKAKAGAVAVNTATGDMAGAEVETAAAVAVVGAMAEAGAKTGAVVVDAHVCSYRRGGCRGGGSSGWGRR